MSDLKAERSVELEQPAQPAQPASIEAETLERNKGCEETLTNKATEETPAAVEKNEEPKLPKLSAADFRAYNSMAEHMEYFVHPLQTPPANKAHDP
jgi:hypothetical protein